MNYVIIGACAAGLATAEAIRKADAKGTSVFPPFYQLFP